MPIFTIQGFFLLYSALSFSGALLITALFWRKDDLSAKLWIYGCLLTSIATLVTVNRHEIPLIISFSLMVSFETLSICLFSDSLRNLLPRDDIKTISKFTWITPAILFLTIEFERYLGDGSINPIMTATASFTFGVANFFCLYLTRVIGKKFNNRLFFHFFSFIFLVMGILYYVRVLNALIGYSGHAFDLKTYNLALWFVIILFGCIRNLAYIVLRLQLGFSEHNRLNNMNLKLSNILDERNEMILSLEKLNKSASINALASTIAHEINQPLGSSKLNAQFVEMQLNSNPENLGLLKEINQRILYDINRTAEIVQNLSRISSSKYSESSKVNLLQSIQEVVEISKGKLRTSKIELNIQVDANQFIQINIGEWQQVLINLLNNAIEALDQSHKGDKKIMIFANLENSIVSVSIQDNGPGIKPGSESKIFELLVSDKKIGSGIGLWLSKNIVARYDGKISAKNNLEAGACITIELPQKL